MITITETATRVNASGKYVSSNERYPEFDTLTALHRLMLILSEESSRLCYLSECDLNIKFGRANSFIYEYVFTGPFAELRPLLLVARQYDFQRADAGWSAGKTARIDAKLLSKLLGEPVMPVGERYNQAWGDLLTQAPLKLAVILGLASECGPIHIREDLIHKPLVALIDELLSGYLHDESYAFLAAARRNLTEVS